MFYRNTLKTKKTLEKEIKYNLFQDGITDKDDFVCEEGSSRSCYNFNVEDGSLKSGYGFSALTLPTSTSDLDSESEFNVQGSEIKAIWKLKWYNFSTDQNNYYLFYYNDLGQICYDNLFAQRITSFVVDNDFTETPYAAYYRVGHQDSLLLSGEGDDLLIITGSGLQRNENAPKIVSCCNHYGSLFAITSSERGTLVYSEETDILNFTDELCQNLDFGDERGDLNKIISFNDYLYIFRDFGITEVSKYGTDDNFAISHLYMSNSYIYPNTITQCGDDIIFLDSSGLKIFNGSSVSEIKSVYNKMLNAKNQSNAWGEFYNGKYFLACQIKFDDSQQIGCESFSGGYINNALLVYDMTDKSFQLLRGVDINRLLTLNNPYKTKLIASFNGEHKGKIGQLSEDGKIFGTALGKYWQSSETDFGDSGKLKKIMSFTIKSKYPCRVTLKSETMQKVFEIKGGDEVQRVPAGAVGKLFTVIIESTQLAKISNFVLTVKLEK